MVIVNDAATYQQFKAVKNLHHAPKKLEAFYRNMGCKLLSELIEENTEPGGAAVDGKESYCTDLRNLVLQRLSYFAKDLDDDEVWKRYQFLNETGKLGVKVYEDLHIVKTIVFGEETKEFRSETTAGCWIDAQKCVELWVISPRTRKLEYFEFVFLSLRMIIFFSST